MDRQEPLNEVLGYYDIVITGIKNETYKEKKGVWWISTPSGAKILKKVSYSEDTMKFILSAIEHLTSNGILIPAINRTKSGSCHVTVNEISYILSDAISGKSPSYSLQHLPVIAGELARFHKASAGFNPPTDSKPKCHLGTWVEDYESQILDMKHFYMKELEKQASGKTPRMTDDIGNLIIREFPGFCRRAEKAIEELKTGGYASWVEKAAEKGCLCHQDFAAGNLIMTECGMLYVLDTDSITIDIPARDIRKLLNKVMKKTGEWDPELAKKILGWYQSVNPLTRGEWYCVRSDLLFPHLFLGAMNKYCYLRDPEWSESKYHGRIREMAAFEKTAMTVIDGFDRLIPETALP